jgi:hypothetical protein
VDLISRQYEIDAAIGMTTDLAVGWRRLCAGG